MNGKTRSLILDVCLPERCSICGASLLWHRYKNDPVCLDCVSSFIPLDGNRCIICSLPLISEESVCMRCRERKSSLDGNISVFLYTDIIAEAVSRFKIKNQKRLASFFSDFLYGVYTEHYSGMSIVPVPFRPSARKKRGWDQVEELSSVLSARYGILVVPVLARKEGRQQKTLSYDERLNNLFGTIEIKRNSRMTFPTGLEMSESVVLLDDIYTTGATVNECARVLKKYGIRNVFSLTLSIDA